MLSPENCTTGAVVMNVSLVEQRWKDGSLMERLSTTIERLATTLIFLFCTLTLVVLVLSSLEDLVPPLPTILSWKDLKVSTPTATSPGSTSLNLWFHNR